jgi:uncharacterized phage protein gp47/JayE
MSYDDAAAVRTEKEARIEIAADLAVRGVSDQGFPETSTQRRLIDNAAARASRGDSLRSQMLRAGSTETVLQISEDDGRDAWAEFLGTGVFGLTRDPATRARHRIRMTNDPNGVTRTITAGSQTVRFGSVDFVNVEVDGAPYAGSGTLAPGASMDLLFEATTAGTVGNVPAGTITQHVTAIAGVTVSNPAVGATGSSIVVPARDVERIADYVLRMRSRFPAAGTGASRGGIVEWIGEAFAYAGLEKTVTKWFIDDENPFGPGTFALYLANDAGPATSSELATVRSYILLRLAPGRGSSLSPTGVEVFAASSLILPIAVQVKAPGRLGEASLASELAAVISGLNADTPLGEATLYRAEVIERFQGVRGVVNTITDFQDTVLEAGVNLVLTGTPTAVA